MRTFKWQKLVTIGIIAILLATFLPLSPMAAAPGNLHPAVAQMAKESPNETLRLVVQKTDTTQKAEAYAEKLGGSVLADLSIIHAFSVEMTAADAVQLSNSGYVRWISLDGKVEESGKPPPKNDPPPAETFYYRENFDVASYSNNDGTVSWANDWLEDDVAGTGPSAGSVFIFDGELFMSDRPDTGTSPSLSRSANLSGATAATLSFNFRTGPGVEAFEDIGVLEISSDGGTSYSTMATFDAYDGNASELYSLDITAFATAETTIRFRVSDAYGGPDEYFAVDNLEILFSMPAPEQPSGDLTENTFLDTMDVRDVWAMGIDGSGVGVAIIDSGVNKEVDLKGNVVVQKSFNANASSVNDFYGHGTHVAGIVAMDGTGSDGFYYGIAPGADIISLKVNDDTGMAYESDVVAAMQWVYENKEAYNIRVVNLSVNSTVAGSYHNSPMDAAAEVLWFNGVVVVASAGNYWTDLDFNPVLAAPANDPFLITVGAFDEKGTHRNKDDVIANYSAFGTTQDGFFKPDIYAPGTNIVSTLARQSDWETLASERIEGGDHFRLSGTSMAAPMVTGAVALLLQAEPNLTPDQVKYRLIQSGQWIGPSRALNVLNLITSNSTESANTGLEASQLLWTGSEPVVWGSVAWNSVAWNSVAWNSVAWNSVAWNSVAWNSVAWNE